MPDLLRRHGSALLAAVAVLCFYVAALRVLPADVFWHPDDGAKFLGLETIHWDEGLTYAVPYPGRRLDPEFKFYPGHCHHGELYPSPNSRGTVLFRWPIWFLLLTRPWFDTFGIIGLYIVPLLSGWCIALVAGRWAAAYDPALAPVAILAVGLASPIAFYSVSFSEHTLTSLVAMLAASLVIFTQPGRPSRCWWVMLCIAGGVALRVELLAFALALAAAWALSGMVVPRRQAARGLRPRTAVALVASAVLMCVAALAGLAPRQRELLTTLPIMFRGLQRKLPYIADNVVAIFLGMPPLPQPFGGLSWKLAGFVALCVVAAAGLVRAARTEGGLVCAGFALVLAMSVVTTVSTEAYLDCPGVLAVAPYMLVGLYVLPEAWRRRDRRWLRLAMAGVAYALFGFLMLFVFRVSGEGTLLVGLDGSVRYMLTLYPIGAVLALLGLQIVRRSDRPLTVKRLLTAIVLAMVFVAALYEFRGLKMLYEKRQSLVAWERALQGDSPVVTDIWWLPAGLAPFFATHEMFCVRTPDELSDWVSVAAAQGVSAFTFASFRTEALQDLGQPAARVIVAGSTVVDGMHFYAYRLLAARP
jgi:hypothetical protein